MHASDNSAVVEHLPLHPKVKGSSLDAGMGREKMAKSLGSGVHASGSSTVVEHLPHYTKI